MSIKSLNCLTLETILLLGKHGLYETLIQNELQDEKINSVAISEDIKQEVTNKFINQLGLKTNEEFDNALNRTTYENAKNLLIKSKEFLDK